MKTTWIIVLAFFLLSAISGFTGTAKAEEAQVSNGIKAVLKVDPAKSMVDLYLYNMAKTLTPMKDAKVKAVVTMPDGKKVEKELIGMKMGDTYSYMNSLDMRLKGGYSFDISVQAGKRKARFAFSYTLKGASKN